MRTKCKIGDLAVIIREEPGLEENIGRCVWVHRGPFLDAEYGTVHVIRPASDDPMATLRFDGSIDYHTTGTYHPDAWLLTVWRPSPSKSRQMRVPLRNLPKINREWLESVMKGEAR